MKTNKISTVIALIMFFAVSAYSQNTETVKIKTSAQCEMCKNKIESEVLLMAGIKSAELNLSDKVLTVNFNSGKISTDKIKAAISKLGYDADEITADKKAYEKLPACCKKQ